MTRVIGLTGGIASGKSTVMRLLQAEGIPTLDADDVVHDLYQHDKTLINQLVTTFGPSVRDDLTGGINRQVLGHMVFGQPDKLARLGALVHPMVRAALIQFIQAHANDRMVVLVIPLLFENGLHTGLMDENGHVWSFDQIWLCVVPLEVQRQRLITSRGLTYADADTRLASQLTLTQKLDFSPVTIDCNGTIESTRVQIQRLLAQWVS